MKARQLAHSLISMCWGQEELLECVLDKTTTRQDAWLTFTIVKQAKITNTDELCRICEDLDDPGDEDS